MCEGCTLVSVNDISEKCVCVPSVCQCFIYPHRSSDGVLSGCDRQTAFPGTQSQMALHAEFVLPGPCCQSVWDSNPPPQKHTHTHTIAHSFFCHCCKRSKKSKIKTAVSQPSVWTLLSLRGMVTGEGGSEFEHMTRIYLTVLGCGQSQLILKHPDLPGDLRNL